MKSLVYAVELTTLNDTSPEQEMEIRRALFDRLETLVKCHVSFGKVHGFRVKRV